MAEYVELYIDKGTNFSTTININNDDTNLPQNLTGFIVTSQLRKSLLSINASANLSCSVSDASNGEITLELSSANSSNLSAGRYFFDVKTVDTRAANAVSRLIEGIIIVSPSITG
jgi:nucleoside-triphosphatase THEP1